MGPNQAVTITAACRATGAKSDRHNTTAPPTQWGQNKPSYWGQFRLSWPPVTEAQIRQAVQAVIAKEPNINEINQVAARLALVGWPLADHC